jgi:hypothetical protein
MDFTNPLDIKFQSDAIGKTILFIGYSAADTNIRFILYKLHREWERAGFRDARPKSFIFFSQPNDVQENVLAQWGVTAISEEVEDPGKALVSFLDRLKSNVHI